MIKKLKLIPGKQLWIFQAYDQGFGFSESLWTSNFYQFHEKKSLKKTETEKKLRAWKKNPQFARVSYTLVTDSILEWVFSVF